MVESLIIFQKLASTETFRKLFLNPLDKECPKDGNVLDMVISKYINPYLEVCRKCKIKSIAATKILNRAAEGFDVSPQVFKEQLELPYFRRGLKSVIRGVKSYGLQKPFLPYTPFLIVWNFTNICNLKCKHCYQDAGKKAKDELTLEQQFRVIDNLSDWGVTVIAFSGGEPLAHPDFFKLAEYTAKKGIAVAIATNGTLITEEVAKKLADLGETYAEVSFDSLDPKEHNKFRGLESAWELTVEGIKNLVEAGVYTCMATFIHKNNYKQIPEFVEFAKNLGAQFWAMFEYKPAGRAKDLKIDMNPEEREEALSILAEVTLEEMKNKKGDKPFTIPYSTAPQFGRKMREISRGEYSVGGHYGFLINMPKLLEFVGGCGAGRAYVALQPNGNITPCVYMPNLVIGNVLKDNLNYLWDTNEILKALRDRDKYKGHCSKCEDKYICGGCRARAYGYLKDVTGPDLGCINNKEYWDKNVNCSSSSSSR
ncbi:MAG: radical SAM protein [Candidatus Woesearchaeota archaeon]|nr:MAG: radical SAM protein [Candidatus Woesearchaeota archaeon]